MTVIFYQHRYSAQLMPGHQRGWIGLIPNYQDVGVIVLGGNGTLSSNTPVSPMTAYPRQAGVSFRSATNDYSWRVVNNVCFLSNLFPF